MLRYLAHPYQLAGVVSAVAVALFGHNLAQAWLARALGDRTPGRAGFLGLAPARQLDPLGVIAAALTYYGWGFSAAVPVATRPARWRPRAALALMAGPVVPFVLAIAYDGLLRASHGSASQQFAISGLLASGGLCVTSLLPFPPLAMGRVLFLYAPTTPGWQRARYQLEETATGRLIAFGVLMLPVVFSSLPDIVGQLTVPLLRLVGTIVGGIAPHLSH